MTDRELLELAAKAAGLNVVDRSFPVTLYVASEGCCGGVSFNPLEDDGDALRLACMLCMTISCGPVSAQANTVSGALRGFSAVEDVVKQDQFQAVRRAIVRAAAEIGRTRK